MNEETQILKDQTTCQEWHGVPVCYVHLCMFSVCFRETRETTHLYEFRQAASFTWGKWKSKNDITQQKQQGVTSSF